MDEGSRPPVLEAQGVTKSFGGVAALTAVDFEVRAGEIHALVGENGAGKSTLIKVLAGVHPGPSFEGRVLADGRPVSFAGVRDAEAQGIAVIHQELQLVKELTVAENVFLGAEPTRLGLVDFERMGREAAVHLGRLGAGVDVNGEVSRLGVGTQQLVEIAKALRKQSRVLILDEPTAALTEVETELLLKVLKGLAAEGAALVYVSHKLDEVFALADRITVLRDGRTVESAPVSDWTRESVVRAMVGREVTEVFPYSAREFGPPALAVRGLTVEDPHIGGRKLLDDVTFEVRAGEVLGVSGLMGAGRSELMLSIFGAPPGPRRGAILVKGQEVRIDSPADALRHGIALLPEDRKQQGLTLFFSILHNLTLAHLAEFCTWGVIDDTRERRQAQDAAAEWGVKFASLDDAAETLSGGNQQKVVLGKWLLKRPAVLILDEPTRGIDVGAKAEIHRLIGKLAGQGMAVIMVSSELPEVLGVSDRVLVLKQGRIAGEFSRAEIADSSSGAELIMEVAT